MRLRRAACLTLVLAAGATSVAGAQLRGEQAPIPALHVQGADNPLSQVAFGTVSFALDRPGYAALFEYSRDGRVRVLYPRQPRDTAPLTAGKTYHAQAWSPDLMLQAASLNSGPVRVPYVFVLTSSRPLDLSRFGDGKGWRRQLVPKATGERPDRLIADVAELVLGERRVFEYDFGYLAPRMSARQQIALYRCASSVAFDRDDYWSYHDLWEAVTPGAIAFGGYGLLASTFWMPGAWGVPVGLATRLSPSCLSVPAQPMYVVLPRYQLQYALGPVRREPPAPPTDSAVSPEPTPEPTPEPAPTPTPALDGTIVEPPVRKADWRSDYRPPTAPRRGNAGVGATQPVDPPASPEELRQKWRAERLASRPQNTDEANLDELRLVNRIMRSRGMSRSEAEAVAERWSEQRALAGSDLRSRRTAERNASEVVRERASSAASHSTAGGSPRAEPARESATSRQGASAPSASSGSAPTQARGDQPKKGQ